MSKKQLNRKWLWLFLGLWLTVFQSIATVHDVEHALSHPEHQCQLCHHASHHAAPPAAIPTLYSITTREQPFIAVKVQSPTLSISTNRQARAPPHYS